MCVVKKIFTRASGKFLDFLSTHWYNPLHGFSVHYPTLTSYNATGESRMIKGSPKHELDGSVRIEGQSTPVMLPSVTGDLSEFGLYIN